MTDQELKDLVASLAIQGRETDRRMQETDRRMQETDRRMQETDRRMQETDRIVKETSKYLKQLGKQMGEIGNKFGRYTEGLSSASIEQMFKQTFGVEETYFRAKKEDKSSGGNFEMDAWGIANGDKNLVAIAEVKNNLDNNAIEQLQRTISNFRTFYPQHEDKRVYGVLVGVDIPKHVLSRAEKLGFYVASVSDTLFKICNTQEFVGKAY